MTLPNEDPEIRDVLRTLPVPQHTAGYRDELRQRLLNEPAPAQVEPTVTQTTRRPHRRLWIAPTIAAAVSALLLINGMTSPSTPHNDVAQPPKSTEALPTPLLVSAVVQKANDTIETVRAVSGTATEKHFAIPSESMPAYQETTTFRVTAAGDYWLHVVTKGSRSGEGSLSTDVQESYNAATNDGRTYTSGSFGTSAQINKNQAVALRGSFSPLDSFTSSLRALAASNDSTVVETTYNGRPAWELTVNPGESHFIAPDHVVVTVDQQTGFPVRNVSSLRGQPYSETTVSDLEVNPELAPADLTVEFPAGLKASTFDAGFKRVAIEDVAGVVGYAPMVPSNVPEGFRLSAVLVNNAAVSGGPEGMNPATTGSVILVYRRGLERLVVQTQRSGGFGEDDGTGMGSGPAWADPYSYEGQQKHAINDVTIDSGAFAGLRAHVVPSSDVPPHLWGVGKSLMLAIGGDLTSGQLVDVAKSLEARQ